MYWLLFYAAIVQTCKAASQPSKEYVETCGWHWQERYIKLHNEIVFGATSPLSSPPRLVIAIPVKAGLADMVLGYVSAFLWALLTDRAFLIARLDHLDDSTQRTIEFGYHSPFINWTAPCIDRSTFACLLPPYGEQWEKCRDTIDILGHSNLSVYHNYGVNGGFTNDMLSRNISLLHSEKDVLTTASNRGVTVNIFKNEFLRQQLLSLGLTNTTAFPCLFNFLFRLNHDVCDLGCKKTAHQLQHAKHNVNVVTIALHVRNPGRSSFYE